MPAPAGGTPLAGSARGTLDQESCIVGAKNQQFGQRDFSGLRDSLAVKLSDALVMTSHHHVTAGQPLMSDSETRASLIAAVCQQDPERWVSLSASTGRC